MRKYTETEMNDIIKNHQILCSMLTIFKSTVKIYLSKDSMAFSDIFTPLDKYKHDFLSSYIQHKINKFGKSDKRNKLFCFIKVDKYETPELCMRITLFKGEHIFCNIYSSKIGMTEFEQKMKEDTIQKKEKIKKSKEMIERYEDIIKINEQRFLNSDGVL